jgi:hypothetical protein
MSDLTFSDNLAATRASRLDILVFLGAFLGGLTVYGGLRALGLSQLIVTVWLIAVMAAYSVAVASLPRLRVRLDQAGDNAYYLGLLFTLVSMAVALHDFGASVEVDRTGAKRIIGDFGIALATTITGIFLRVVLHQMRVDPGDVESMTRIELAEAAKRVKAKLDAVSIELGRFFEETTQRGGDQMRHLFEQVGATLGDFTSRVIGATTELTNATSTAHHDALNRVADVTKRLSDLVDATEGAARRLRQVEPPPVQWVARLQKVSDAFGIVADEAERAGGRLSEAGVASASASRALIDVSSTLAKAGEAANRQQEESVKRIEDAAIRLKTALDAVGQTLEEDRKRLSTLEDQSRRSIEAALQSQEAANRVLDSFVTITRELTDFINRNG